MDGTVLYEFPLSTPFTQSPLSLIRLSLVRCCSSENLEPHSAPLEIGHPEVGRYFSEFANTYYFANEELQTRYPEDIVETLGTVQELYHRLTPGLGNQDQASATDQNNHRATPM